MGVWSYDFVEAQTHDEPQAQAHDVDRRVYSLSPFAMDTFYGNRTTREGRRSPGADRALARRSMHGTLRHRSGAQAAHCRWKVIRRFIMKSGCRSCALAAASSSALGINHRKITHTSTSRWAMPVRSSAPIALRYSASIRAWAHTKLIRQIVLTVMTELNCAASFVMPAAANQRQAPSFRSFGAVHDGHERSEFGRMQASRRPNQRWRLRATKS